MLITARYVGDARRAKVGNQLLPVEELKSPQALINSSVASLETKLH